MPPRRPAPKEARTPPTERLRIELDLAHELLRPSRIPVLRQIEALLREQEVEEQGSLLVRASELLHELGDAGFERVDHWELSPGGWLPLPEPAHRGKVEPVGHVLRALESRAWASLAHADAFAVRLSDADGRRADARVLHLHREREHSISVELWDPPAAAEVRRLIARLRARFAPLRVRLRHEGV